MSSFGRNWPPLRCADQKVKVNSTCFNATDHHTLRTMNALTFQVGDKGNNLPKVVWDCLVSCVPLNWSVAAEITSLFFNLSTDTVLSVDIILRHVPSASYSPVLDAFISESAVTSLPKLTLVGLRVHSAATDQDNAVASNLSSRAS